MSLITTFRHLSVETLLILSVSHSSMVLNHVTAILLCHYLATATKMADSVVVVMVSSDSHVIAVPLDTTICPPLVARSVIVLIH